MALLSAVLIQGRIIWWATPWLGYAAAASVLLISAAMLIEHNRANPLLNTRWIGSREIITFEVGAAVMRVLLSEQRFGAFGLLSAAGLGNDQPILYQGVLTLAPIAGLAVGLMALNPLMLLLPVLILCIRKDR